MGGPGQEFSITPCHPNGWSAITAPDLWSLSAQIFLPFFSVQVYSSLPSQWLECDQGVRLVELVCADLSSHYSLPFQWLERYHGVRLVELLRRTVFRISQFRNSARLIFNLVCVGAPKTLNASG